MVNRIIPFRDRLRLKRRLIVFICTGNTCRSPMAAAYLRHLLIERGIKNIEVRSAGVMTINGLLASPEAVQVMAADEIGLDRHRSTPLTPELVRKADLILAMSPFHRQTAIRLCEDAKNKSYLLKEFTGSDYKNAQITDPMGCTLEVFKKVYKEIKAACEQLVEHEFITGVSSKPREGEGKGGRSPARRTVRKKKVAARAAKSERAEEPAKAKARPAAERAGAAPAGKSGRTASIGKGLAPAARNRTAPGGETVRKAGKTSE